MKRLSLIIKCLLPMFIILLYTASVFGQEEEIRVTIKGMLSNIDDVGAYINSQTHLQLYPCEVTGQVNVQMEEKGKMVPVPGQTERRFYLDGLKRLVPPSTLSSVGLPVFGMFNFFKVRGLETGKCYKICVMMLDNPYPGLIALSKGDGKPLEIVIPEADPDEKKKDIVVDLTKDPLLIPQPKKR